MNSLELSRHILTTLQLEKIATPENTSGTQQIILNRKLNTLRSTIPKVINTRIAPQMTICVTLTLLKAAACQELVERFALEYLLHKKFDISLIFTAKENAINDNHCFAILGKVFVNEELKVVENLIPEKKYFIPIQEFLGQQNASIVADPLLNITFPTSENSPTFMSYFEKHQITHVIGVKTYSEEDVYTANFIKTKAYETVEKVKSIISIYDSEIPKQPSNSQDLIAVIKKFKLDENDWENVSLREQAFRRAAFAGTVEDLKILLSTGININAQDSNPLKKETALHLAIKNNKTENAMFLLGQGAKKDIPNAQGKVAKDLISFIN